MIIMTIIIIYIYTIIYIYKMIYMIICIYIYIYIYIYIHIYIHIYIYIYTHNPSILVHIYLYTIHRYSYFLFLNSILQIAEVDWASVLLAQALGQVVLSPIALVISGQELRRRPGREMEIPWRSHGDMEILDGKTWGSGESGGLIEKIQGFFRRCNCLKNWF